MLQKFLFVGLGGSGGKTLRLLYEMLSQRLLEARYDGGVPAAWQFVHIDVPVVTDANVPDLADQLPNRSYVGMAPRGLTYRNLDELLMQRGPAVIEHSAGWRPRPDRVGVDPSSGAGQYRAVGRAIMAAAIPKVAEKLQQAVDALEEVSVNEELSRVALRLTGKGESSDRDPQAVVVSSIAGGSGGGCMLDVCDAIRAIAPKWGDESAAFLYLPDVFADIPPANRAGVTANALATIAEVMAAYWSDGSFEHEHALLEGAGLPISSMGRRGPRYPLLVGRSNGQIRFGTQLEVYRAAARALAAWTTDPHVQNSVNVAFFGNWSTAASARPDATRLTDGKGLELPFSAMGFASVGLGRDRFARYAAERLAREAVERLLRGHWTKDVPHRKTDEEAVIERATSVKHQFLELCGLRELGPHHNQIIDALRGGEERSARESDKQAVRARIRSAVVGSAEAEAAWVLSRVKTQVRDNWEPFVDQQFQNDQERARAWFREAQDAITTATAQLLGQEGAPVTAAVLDLMMKELSNAVVPELREMSAAARAYASQNDQRIDSSLAGFEGKILSENPLIDKAISEGINSFHAAAEANLYDLCSHVVDDLSEHALKPLRRAVTRAEQGLRAAEQGSAERPSIVKAWPGSGVPDSYRPGQNEILLEDPDTYPDVFGELVRSSTGFPDSVGGLLHAARQVIAGENRRDDERPAAVRRTGDWIPKESTLRTNATPRDAEFQVDISPEQLLDRATDWIHNPETAIGLHVAESLKNYLGEDATDPQSHAERLERFRTALKSALTASRPLVDVDRAVDAKIHGATESDSGRYLEVSSRFPFPSGHPAREVVEEVLHYKDPGQFTEMFDDSERSRIEIATFLAAPCQPVVFDSLVEPIRSDWAKSRAQPNLGGFWDRRRARPLPQFVPAHTGHVREMVRGWFVARLLNHVEVTDVNHEPVRIWTETGWVPFPHPLLTAPITDMQNLLPAVLESMAIAIIGDPDTSLKPYWQLRLLGTEQQAWEQRDEAVRQYLRRWVVQGDVPAGAPTPQPTMAGTSSDDPEQRIEAILKLLDRYRQNYAGLAEQVIDASSALEVPDVWELRHVITRELKALMAAVQDMRKVEPGDVW